MCSQGLPSELSSNEYPPKTDVSLIGVEHNTGSLKEPISIKGKSIWSLLTAACGQIYACYI